MNLLDDDTEGLLALGLLGGLFAHYAADHLLRIHGCWSEVRYWILISGFKRGDRRSGRQFLEDWKAQDRRPMVRVSKFLPGQHYHVLDEKFDTLSDAIEHLRRLGYGYGGLTETHVYGPE